GGGDLERLTGQEGGGGGQRSDRGGRVGIGEGGRVGVLAAGVERGGGVQQPRRVQLGLRRAEDLAAQIDLADRLAVDRREIVRQVEVRNPALLLGGVGAQPHRQDPRAGGSRI